MTKAKACVRCATGSTLTIEDEWGDLATSCMSCGMVTYPQTPKREFKAIAGWRFPDEEIVTRTCLGCRRLRPALGTGERWHQACAIRHAITQATGSTRSNDV